ncbi:MAG: GlmU family protein [Ignavibacteriaceae bacterium]|nr:GlmU family protein [Ignavibacteriaceae bacterium]
MEICIFEDIYYDRLEPLIYSRPAYDLVCGMNMLREKIARAYPGVRVSLHTRPYLDAFLKNKYPDITVNTIHDDECLFVNGRMLAPENLAEIIPIDDKVDKLYISGDNIAAARVSGSKLKEIKKSITDLLSRSNFDSLPVEKVDIRFVDYCWDLISNNGAELLKDQMHIINKVRSEKKELIRGEVHPGVHMIERDNIFIAEGARILPGVVLDATNGPIVIDHNAVIYSNAVIEGSVYVGEFSQVKSCSRIYESVSIGRVCKIGGELEHSIVHSLTNKQHAGFLGHAYLGSWVNIGADTNCSDLKNNYGSVKIYVNGEMVNSGQQFLGVIMGDHSKTSINTMINTGTVVGFSCNLFGSGFPPKYIPSFSWGGSESMTTYDLERSLETAKRVMLRRNKIMSEPEEKLIRKVFDLTQKERRKRGYPY